MRPGRPYSQRSMLAVVDLEESVPEDHLLLGIEVLADVALERPLPEFGCMYPSVGRASVPSEPLLRLSC